MGSIWVSHIAYMGPIWVTHMGHRPKMKMGVYRVPYGIPMWIPVRSQIEPSGILEGGMWVSHMGPIYVPPMYPIYGFHDMKTFFFHLYGYYFCILICSSRQ